MSPGLAYFCTHILDSSNIVRSSIYISAAEVVYLYHHESRRRIINASWRRGYEQCGRKLGGIRYYF